MGVLLALATGACSSKSREVSDASGPAQVGSPEDTGRSDAASPREPSARDAQSSAPDEAATPDPLADANLPDGSSPPEAAVPPVPGSPTTVTAFEDAELWLFGRAVALARDDLAISAFAPTSQGDGMGPGPGRARMFVHGAGGFTQVDELASTGNRIGFYDAYGLSLWLDGETLAVGSALDGQEVEGSTKPTGAVYVYARASVGGSVQWMPVARMRPGLVIAQQSFGWSVAISGNTLVAGAIEPSLALPSAPAPNALGSAYVFSSSDGQTWTETGRLFASNGKANDRFAEAVALQGDTLVIGAPREDGIGTGVDGDMANPVAANRFDFLGSGAVYVFERSGSTFVQRTYLKASVTSNADHFGQSVALDGDTLAVGAPGQPSASAQDAADQSLTGAGAVWIFERGATGWQQTAFLKASHPGAGDRFGSIGSIVALSGDRLVVTAPNEASAATGLGGDETDDSAPGTGAAYLFERRAGVWQQVAYLKPTLPIAYSAFGTSAAVSSDRIAVGAWGGPSAGQGAAYVFE
jgi:hypothetical protein